MARIETEGVVRAPIGLAVIGVTAALLVLTAAAPPPEEGDAVVAADHRLASEAGAEVLRRGGNAVDAAVAAALAAGVVQPAGSGLGGGGFALGQLPGGRRFVVDFREVAPAAATRDLFRTPDGGVHPTASVDGGLAVAVPSESRGLASLVSRFGRLSPDKVAAPAVRLAAAGFAVGPHLAGSLGRTHYREVQQMFDVGGHVARSGEVVRRPELAKTLTAWGRTAGEDLHTGAGARRIEAAVRATGGVLTLADLAAALPKDREPLVGHWKDYTLVTMPPPSSGGVVLLQVLGVLEGYDLASLGHNSSDYVHLVTEAFKHAYADRAHHLGDPDFVEVPTDRLVSPERIDEVRRAIWPGRTFPPETYGAPVEPPRDAGTQHISVVDRDGGAVALTTTINNSFGAGVVVPALGLILNDEMDDFAAAPGVPNAFGLVGDEANRIEAGKRPLSSMTPTVVLDAEGRVVLVVGASGGSTIISATVQVLLSVLEFGMDPQEAVAAPRFHHQWMPDTLVLEPDFPRDVVRALEARGHQVALREAFSAVQAVRVTDGGSQGGADPRKGGWPAGVRGSR